MKKRKTIKVTNTNSAKAYLKNVISNWKEFAKSHPQFIKAIKLILNDKKNLLSYRQDGERI